MSTTNGTKVAPSKSFPEKRCGVLGATGSVGQRFILLLAQHPHFRLTSVGASPRSAGKKYKDAVKWLQSSPMSKELGELMVKECKPEAFQGEVDIVFSGLDSDVAGDAETAFRKANIPVFSNAKNYRQDPSVPLVVPTVNLPHLSLITHQRKQHDLDKGFIVCNSNCATVGLVVPFAALQHKFGPIKEVTVTTLQAISGAGYPGLSALDISNNVNPYISGEEDKLEIESSKILGGVDGSGTAFEELTDLVINARCTRVPVLHGHTACVSFSFVRRPPPNVDDCKQALRDYVSDAQKLGCPSAPSRAIVVMEEPDRPQPRMDVDVEGGYAVSVGGLRKAKGSFDIEFVSLSHNLVLGAAGGSILNAEAAVLQGYI